MASSCRSVWTSGHNVTNNADPIRLLDSDSDSDRNIGTTQSSELSRPCIVMAYFEVTCEGASKPFKKHVGDSTMLEEVWVADMAKMFGGPGVVMDADDVVVSVGDSVAAGAYTYMLAPAGGQGGGAASGDVLTELRELKQYVKQTRHGSQRWTPSRWGAFYLAESQPATQFKWSDSTAASLADDLDKVPEDKEAAIVRFYLPRLNEEVQRQGGSLYVVTDSQKCRWLLQDQACDDENRLGPDCIVGLSPCIELIRTRKNTIKGCQPAWNCGLQKHVHCIFEWKKGSALSPRALGQLLTYHFHLPNDVNHGVCIDRANFRAVRSVKGCLTHHIVGKTTDPGSLEFLAKFALGPGPTFSDYESNSLIARIPAEITMEAELKWAVPIWLGRGYRLCENPILGIGGSAWVLAFTKAPRLGHDAGDAVDSPEIAVKVVKGSYKNHFQSEILAHKNIPQSDTHSTMSEIEWSSVPDEPGPAMGMARIQPIGLPNPVTFEQALRALLEFHALGWIHGDVRDVNFILSGGKAVLIDLAHSYEGSGVEELRDDVGDCICSFIGLRLPSRSESDWETVLHSNHPSLVKRVYDLYPLGSDGADFTPDEAAVKAIVSDIRAITHGA
eukprot:m.330555 g.330555  ORF g.330555 m.330555 type:complete len:614 (-) comp16512_c1_seq6:263-2104(-)